LIEAFHEFGVRLVMNGNHSVPSMQRIQSTRQAEVLAWTGGADGLHVIGNGSTGASAEHLSKDFQSNTMGVYQPTEVGIRAFMMKYSPLMNPSRLFELMLPIYY
jgi:hypothetical protein